MNLLAKKIKNINHVPLDYFLLTDNLSDQDIEIMIKNNNIISEKVLITIDHDTPAGTISVANRQKKLRNFARENNIRFYYGRGIGYYIAMENFIKHGDIMGCIGKHAATIGACGAMGVNLQPMDMQKALETGYIDLSDSAIIYVCLTGKFSKFVNAKDLALLMIQEKKYSRKIVAIQGPQLTFEDKVTICNLLGEADITSAFFVEQEIIPDYTYILDELEVKAVFPGNFEHIISGTQIDGIGVHQVFIGGCCGGGIEALRMSARIWRGKKVSKYVRTMIAPASAKIYEQAINEGLIETFMAAHVLVMNPGCSACWAQSQGRCDDNEIFVTTGSINCANWVGSNNNGIYITSIESAAKAALTGFLYED